MQPKIIVWDGKHFPRGLRRLPPGHYAIEPLDVDLELTAEEEKGILKAMASMDAGKGIPMEDVVASLLKQPLRSRRRSRHGARSSRRARGLARVRR